MASAHASAFSPACAVVAPPSGRFVRRLGPHHFAHLRAVAEGLQLSESAWRLVGLRISSPGGAPRPSLDAFAQHRGLEDFSESEVLTLYAEAFPLERKTARGQRLRERQLALLRRLEGLAAETPQPSDAVAGWFDEALAARLVTAGLLTLDDLNARISAGGVWWRALPAVGIAKARRIEHHLATLLARQAPPAQGALCLEGDAGAVWRALAFSYFSRLWRASRWGIR